MPVPSSTFPLYAGTVPSDSLLGVLHVNQLLGEVEGGVHVLLGIAEENDPTVLAPV